MNHPFHINVFSQISPAPSSPIEWWDIGVVTPSEGWNLNINKIRTAVATGLLALSLSAGAQERPTATAISDTQPILLAQAATETDGNTYIAEVIQVDGSKKTVKYFRNTDGIIIPPPIVDWKLVDGSDAPNDAMRAKMAQKKILAKYDRGILLALAMVWPKDLISDAFKDIGVVSDLAKQWKSASKEQIQKSLFGQYILILSGSKIDEIMKTTEFIAINHLKLSIPEFNQMKKEAEIKAIAIWKSTTGTKTIG